MTGDSFHWQPLAHCTVRFYAVSLAAMIALGAVSLPTLAEETEAVETALPAESSNAAEPAIEAQEVNRLIEQLGHDEFFMRESAAAELLEVGYAAKVALVEAAKHPDAEIRSQAQRLVAMIDWHYFNHRVEAFLNFQEQRDANGELIDRFPGWSRFCERFDDGPDQRKMFVDILLADGPLLHAYERGSKATEEYFTPRLNEWQRMGQHELGERGLSLLLVASDDEIEMNLNVEMRICSAVARAYPAIKRHQDNRAFQNMISQWIVRRASHPSIAYQKVNLALQNDLAVGLQPALALLDENGRIGAYLGYAVLAVGKFGTEEHETRLETLLENETIVTNMRVNNEVRQVMVCDVAMAMLLHRSAGSLKDHGFDNVQASPATLYHLHTLYRTPEARVEGLKKWREAREAEGK